MYGHLYACSWNPEAEKTRVISQISEPFSSSRERCQINLLTCIYAECELDGNERPLRIGVERARRIRRALSLAYIASRSREKKLRIWSTVCVPLDGINVLQRAAEHVERETRFQRA